jgi:hypothetical protein
MGAEKRRSLSPWWLLPALLAGVQIGLLAAPAPAPGPPQVSVLLPLMPLTGAPVEAELIESGLLLPPETEGGELDRLGNRLADRLGNTAWLGPTMSVDDFTLGLAHMNAEPGLALSPDQQAELQPILERLHAVRLELDRSERELSRLGEQLACARLQLIESLSTEQRLMLLRRAPSSPGDGR